MHRGTFVPATPYRGESVAPLRGEGSLEVLPQGLRVQGRATRTTLVNVLAGLTATGLMLVGVVATVLVTDAMAVEPPMKLAVAIGLAGLLAGWVGGEWVFARVLPTRALDHTIGWAYLLSGQPIASGVELVSSDPACPGRFAFQTAEPHALLEGLERAKRGR